jgi:hypothetical protein
MSLLVFISGMFVWKSLQRKGSARFVSDRIIRLGVPFAFASMFLSPLAYYPTYLISSSHSTIRAFLSGWVSLPAWRSGPAWFLWVLLAFDCAAAGIFVVAPGWGEVPSRITKCFADLRYFSGRYWASPAAHISLWCLPSVLRGGQDSDLLLPDKPAAPLCNLVLGRLHRCLRAPAKRDCPEW